MTDLDNFQVKNIQEIELTQLQNNNCNCFIEMKFPVWFGFNPEDFGTKFNIGYFGGKFYCTSTESLHKVRSDFYYPIKRWFNCKIYKQYSEFKCKRG